MSADLFDGCRTVELAEAIGQLHAVQACAMRLMLSAVSAFDTQEGWAEDGATLMVPWLVATLGVSHRRAAEWVTIAKRLAELPAIAAAFGEGRLSWDQVAPLVTFATPESDEELAVAATGWSAAQVAAMARRARPISPEETDDSNRRRSLRWWWGADRSLRLRGQLPDAQGAVVIKALELLADRAKPEPETGEFEPYEARCADALVELASGSLAQSPGADRATVVVHTEVSTLVGDGNAELEGGPAIAAETARRLACDARLQIVADGPDGRTVGVGRTTRSIPPWLVRVLRQRDGGCRFPSCDRSRWTDAHHLVHWSRGGPTDLSNLALLCRTHHMLLHEGGWRVEGNPDHELRFIRPNGRVLSTGPPPLREDIRNRLFGERSDVA